MRPAHSLTFGNKTANKCVKKLTKKTTQAKIECINNECRAKTTAGSFMHAVSVYKWQAHR